jgi:hypothetical protein
MMLELLPFVFFTFNQINTEELEISIRDINLKYHTLIDHIKEDYIVQESYSPLHN